MIINVYVLFDNRVGGKLMLSTRLHFFALFSSFNKVEFQRRYRFFTIII